MFPKYLLIIVKYMEDNPGNWSNSTDKFLFLTQFILLICAAGGAFHNGSNVKPKTSAKNDVKG